MERVNELISNVDKLDGQFSYMEACPDEKPVYFNVPNVRKNLNDISDFLKSLQPSGNEEIVDKMSFALGEIVGYLHDDDLSSVTLKSHQLEAQADLLSEAIDALSRPAPFDVLACLNSGERARAGTSNRYIKKFGVGACWVTDGSQLEEGEVTSGEFLSVYWQPYTPPEPELEEGWYRAKEVKYPVYHKAGKWLYSPDGEAYPNQACTPVSRLIEQPEV